VEGQLPTYALTVSAGTGGTASGTQSGVYAEGAEINVTATANSGYTFSGWTTGDGVTFSDAAGATATFTMPGKNVTVTANWTADPIDYTVTVNGSYASATGAGTYREGVTVTVNAGTRSGYTFTGWTTGDGVTFSDAKSTTATFTMPGKNVTVTANWEQTTNPPSPTGDTGNTALWASVMLSSALAIIYIHNRRRKSIK